MDIDVIDFQINPCRRKVAFALIRYHQMIIRCDVVYFERDHKVWLRMPEMWLNPEMKLSYCYWPERDVSDEFQKTVLKIIFDKYDTSLENLAKIHKNVAKKRKETIKRNKISKKDVDKIQDNN